MFVCVVDGKRFQVSAADLMKYFKIFSFFFSFVYVFASFGHIWMVYVVLVCGGTLVAFRLWFSFSFDFECNHIHMYIWWPSDNEHTFN